MRPNRRQALLLAALLVTPTAAQAQFQLLTPGTTYFEQFLVPPTELDVVLSLSGGSGFVAPLGGTSYTTILNPLLVIPQITILQSLVYPVYDQSPFVLPLVTETLEEEYEGYEGSPNDPPGVTTTPEPSTIVLLGTGMAGVLAMRAFRRRKSRMAAE